MGNIRIQRGGGLQLLNWTIYRFYFLLAELYFFRTPQAKYLFQFVCGDICLF